MTTGKDVKTIMAQLPDVELGSVWRLPSGRYVLVGEPVVVKGDPTLNCSAVDCVNAAMIPLQEMTLTVRFFAHAKLAWSARQWAARAHEIHAQREAVGKHPAHAYDIMKLEAAHGKAYGRVAP